MGKTFRFFNRILLTFGVLVALTPCAVCKPSFAGKSASMSFCPMAGKMSCCHKAKPRAPLCQVMDQSSVSGDSVHAESAALSPLGPAPFIHPVLTPVRVCLAVPFTASPPRSSSILRI